MAKIDCTHTNRRGNPCGAPAVHSTDPPVCLSHGGQELRDKVGFGGSQPGAGRPRLPSPTEVARSLIEQHVVAILRPYFLTLGLELQDAGPGEPPVVVPAPTAVIVGKSAFGDVIPSTVEDLGAQIKAAEALLDRVFGRPRQVQEVTGAGGGPIHTATTIAPSDPDAVARLLAQTGALDAARAQQEDDR